MKQFALIGRHIDCGKTCRRVSSQRFLQDRVAWNKTLNEILVDCCPKFLAHSKRLAIAHAFCNPSTGIAIFSLRPRCISRINTLVTPFPITIQPGVPISDQIVYAAKRAIIAGHMRPGEAFPSVRALSKDLRINPNTAHKAVTELINAGLLEMHPGIGTVVATPPDATPRERTKLLARQIEELVVEACRLGVDQEELLRSIAKQYQLLTPSARGQVRR